MMILCRNFMVLSMGVSASKPLLLPANLSCRMASSCSARLSASCFSFSLSCSVARASCSSSWLCLHLTTNASGDCSLSKAGAGARRGECAHHPVYFSGYLLGCHSHGMHRLISKPSSTSCMLSKLGQLGVATSTTNTCTGRLTVAGLLAEAIAAAPAASAG